MISVVFVDDNDIDLSFDVIVARKLDGSLPVVSLPSGQALLDFLSAPERTEECCVFLDINMPVMNGFETLENIQKSQLNLDGVSIYMLSSSMDPEDERKALSFPFVKGYVSKPLSRQSLQASLDSTRPPST